MALIYLETGSTDPSYNLALEQVAFDRLDRGHEYVMLWQNDNAVIVGKHQITAEEVNEQAIRQHGMRVVRRLSGGGAVYHDLGNLNFTLIADAGRAGQLDFALFCRPVASLLKELGVAAEVGGRNDITVSGQKFSGNAQYLREGRVMHHGTILFDSDLELVGQALRVSADKISAKGVTSVRSRVTNLRPHLPQQLTLQEFWQLFVKHLFGGQAFRRHDFTAAELAEAEALRASRYATWEWNYGASPPCTLRRSARFEGCGGITALLDLSEGRIAALAFRGDFFGTADPGALEQALLGLPLERLALEERLTEQLVGATFRNLRQAQLLDLLLGNVCVRG